MSRLVILVLFLLTLCLSITAQDPTSTSTPDPSSTAGAGDGDADADATPTPTPTPTVPSSDTGSATTTPPTSTVTVSSSSSSSSTGPTTNGTNTNTTVTPTSNPTTAPSSETGTGRAICPGNDAFTEALKNDLPPWNCPRLDVDGGALGPRNNYDPCRSLTIRLGAQRNGTVTTDFVCTQAPVAGLNSSKAYVYAKDKKGYSLPTLVTKGDVYPVAIVTSNVLFNKKMIFQPLVDSFTSLEIAASHGVQWFSVPNTFISLEAGGLTSGPRSRIFRIPGLDAKGTGVEGETMAQNYWKNPKEGFTWREEYHYGIVPFWTVLINVDNGRITSINWDEGCDACADQLCSSDGNCGVDEYSCALVNGTTTRAQNDTETLPEYDIRQLSDCALNASIEFNTNVTWDPMNYQRVRAIADSCIASKQIRSNTQSDALSMVQAAQKRIPQTPPAGGNTDCGIKIYLGWTGTDQNGKFFTSAGKRLSVFRKYSIGAAFNSASQYVDQQLPEAPTEDVSSGPGNFEG